MDFQVIWVLFLESLEVEESWGLQITTYPVGFSRRLLSGARVTADTTDLPRPKRPVFGHLTGPDALWTTVRSCSVTPCETHHSHGGSPHVSHGSPQVLQLWGEFDFGSQNCCHLFDEIPRGDFCGLPFMPLLRFVFSEGKV